MQRTGGRDGGTSGNANQAGTAVPPQNNKRRSVDFTTETRSKRARTNKDGVEYCGYCGDDVTSGIEADDKSTFHEECFTTNKLRSEKAIEDFRKAEGGYRVLCIALHVNYLNGVTTCLNPNKKKRKREKRDRKLKELLKKASALRNTSGGFLFVHLVGLAVSDSCFAFFDEFADVELNRLLADGTQFDNAYKKQRLSNYKDILVINITAGTDLTTTEFYSKISLDVGLEDSSKVNVLSLLKESRSFKDSFHNPGVKTGSDVVVRLQENRYIQFKRYYPDKKYSSVDAVSVLRNTRLPEYASAFTKLSEGGSLFFGIWEKNEPIEGYNSKKLEVECVPIGNNDQFKIQLKDELLKELKACHNDGTPFSPELLSDIVDVDLLPSCGGVKCTLEDSAASSHYTVHVSFKPVRGIVFHDRGGPVAYRIEDDQVKPYTLEEWFRITLREMKVKLKLGSN